MPLNGVVKSIGGAKIGASVAETQSLPENSGRLIVMLVEIAFVFKVMTV